MLQVGILTGQLVLMPRDVSKELTLSWIKYEGISFLSPSCLKKHQDVPHANGFLMLLLQPACLLIGVLERILSR